MTDWTQIQGVVNTAGGVTTVNESFASTIANGNIVVGAVLLDAAFTLTSVTDDKSNAYTVFDSHDDGSLYTVAFRSNGFLTNGPKILTYNFSGATGNQWMVQDEFQPPTGATAVSVDGSSQTSNSAGTSFASFSTSLSDDLVYAVAMSSGTSTHGTSFNLGTGNGTARCSEWGIQSSPGSVTMDLATQTNHFWGPAFAINGGSSPPASASSGIVGAVTSEW